MTRGLERRSRAGNTRRRRRPLLRPLSEGVRLEMVGGDNATGTFDLNCKRIPEAIGSRRPGVVMATRADHEHGFAP